MGYEVDYLAVGEGEKSADAICLRYGNLLGRREDQVVITIDGGTLESGDALVEHIRTYYRTDRVDIAILSHPDADHASGMRRILENLKVGKVAMHLPWNHSVDVKGLLDDGRVSTNSIREKAKRNLSAARELADLATEKGIPVVEPFAGVGNGSGLVVLGPTEEFYEEMLAGFKFMPGAGTGTVTRSFAEALNILSANVTGWIRETWLSESLQDPDPDATSSENNSSVILLIDVGGRKLLFTGDAGVAALDSAADFADASRTALTGICFFDVPHHGSRRNLGPSILNRIFGGVRGQDSQDWTAFVSAAKGGEPKHPHKKVTNALRRRGAGVHVTAGRNIWHHVEAPERAGWTPIEPLQFYPQVENDDGD